MISYTISPQLNYRALKSQLDGYIRSGRTDDWALELLKKTEGMRIGELASKQTGHGEARYECASPENRFYGELAQRLILEKLRENGFQVEENDKEEYFSQLQADGGWDAKIWKPGMQQPIYVDVKTVSGTYIPTKQQISESADYGFTKMEHQVKGQGKSKQPVVDLTARILFPKNHDPQLIAVSALWDDEFLNLKPIVYPLDSTFDKIGKGQEFIVESEPLYFMPYKNTCIFKPASEQADKNGRANPNKDNHSDFDELIYLANRRCKALLPGSVNTQENGKLPNPWLRDGAPDSEAKQIVTEYAYGLFVPNEPNCLPLEHADPAMLKKICEAYTAAFDWSRRHCTGVMTGSEGFRTEDYIRAIQDKCRQASLSEAEALAAQITILHRILFPTEMFKQPEWARALLERGCVPIDGQAWELMQTSPVDEIERLYPDPIQCEKRKQDFRDGWEECRKKRIDRLQTRRQEYQTRRQEQRTGGRQTAGQTAQSRQNAQEAHTGVYSDLTQNRINTTENPSRSSSTASAPQNTSCALNQRIAQAQKQADTSAQERKKDGGKGLQDETYNEWQRQINRY